LDQLWATPLKIQLLTKKKSNLEKGCESNFGITIELQGRKPHQPNWEHGKILDFIFKAKINEHVVNMDKIDGLHLFKSTIIIWKKITTCMMNEGCSTHRMNGVTCKVKRSA
jgi:hypothetical protein